MPTLIYGDYIVSMQVIKRIDKFDVIGDFKMKFPFAYAKTTIKGMC